MGERKISPLYRLIKAAVRAVYPKIRVVGEENLPPEPVDRKSTRLNSSH